VRREREKERGGEGVAGLLLFCVYYVQCILEGLCVCVFVCVLAGYYIYIINKQTNKNNKYIYILLCVFWLIYIYDH